MPIRREYRYTRVKLRAEPNSLFVFGDNMRGNGFGGQAKACRGEPNAVGIPTKWRPSMSPGSFFSDDDAKDIIPAIRKQFDILKEQLAAGGVVVWPLDGIGTGLAQLGSRAPLIAKEIEDQFKILCNVYGEFFQ